MNQNDVNIVLLFCLVVGIVFIYSMTMIDLI